MPESCAARRLEIFHWDMARGRWISHAAVFLDRPVADAVLFRKDDLFWIAYTDVTHDPHDNLHLVYASDLTGPWLAHPSNPVQRGKERCRGAGPVFTVGGKYYRPAQDCSSVYGGGMRIMEIVTFTPTAYEEAEITRIVPSSQQYPDGFHTLAAWGDCCLVDGMRLTFSWRLVWDKLRKRLSL
jgi:hypothetical protein